MEIIAKVFQKEVRLFRFAAFGKFYEKLRPEELENLPPTYESLYGKQLALPKA